MAIMKKDIIIKMNRGQVFRKICTYDRIYRASLSRELNINKMTVTNIVKELIDNHLIEEKGILDRGLPHKNPIALGLSNECPKVIGVEIQREFCEAVLCDFKLNVIRKERFEFEEINLNILKRALETIVTPLVGIYPVVGISVASIGPLDITKGVILNPPNFGDIINFDVSAFLNNLYEIPVVLKYHYDCAVLARIYFGNLSSSDFLYIGLTKGVGMSGYFDGDLYSNRIHNIPEIGHLSVNIDGSKCRCGNKGCLENYVSTDIMQKELNKILDKKLSFSQLCSINDDRIKDYLLAKMKFLSVALVNMVNIFKPSSIIIGDLGRYLPCYCITYLENTVNECNLYKNLGRISVNNDDMNEDFLAASSSIGIIEAVFKGEYIFN